MSGKPVAFLAATAEMTDLGWRQMLRSKLLWGIAVAIVFAAIIAIIIRQSTQPVRAAENFQGLQVLLLSTVIVPLLSLLMGTGALATEREGGTLAYLFTRPFRRSAVILGKGVGAILVADALTVLAALAVYAGSGFPSDAQVMGGILALVIESTALTALFVLFGTVLARSLYLGLAYVVLVEGVLGNAVGAQSPYTITYHARNLLSEWSGARVPSGVLGEFPEPAAQSVLTLLVVAVVALVAAGAWVETREYGLRDRAKED